MAGASDLDELRRTAELYAIGADRRDKALWRAVLAEDCVIDGPGFTCTGLEENLGSIDLLGTMFRRTAHRVSGQIAQIDGDTARGETFGTAEHLLNDADAVLAWTLRYQDRWQRRDGSWRFTHRKIVIDWEETRPVKPGA
jgi:hypothetical protein